MTVLVHGVSCRVGFVMHLQTRMILLAEVTFSPHSGWLEQTERHVVMSLPS